MRHYNDPSIILQKHVCGHVTQIYNYIISSVPTSSPIDQTWSTEATENSKLTIMNTINELLESLTVYLRKFTVPVEFAVSC